jgi:carotenoid cleavage dioxygenase-like enzyme
VWGVGAVRPTAHANAVTKTDLAGGGRAARWAEPGGVVCEPVLVPRPGAAAEDDGAVLVTAEAAGGGGSVLAVLDAATLAPLCRLRLPSPLPYGFHGVFVPAPAR